MVDIFTPERRSAIMSRIRSSGTQQERRLQAMVREILGVRQIVQHNVIAMPGRPDVVVPTLRLVIFADGCFYHGCPEHGHEPKSNRGYWLPKLKRNARRDAANRRKLRAMGYSVWCFWEHDFRSARLDRTFKTLMKRIGKRRMQLKLKVFGAHPAHYARGRELVVLRRRRE